MRKKGDEITVEYCSRAFIDGTGVKVEYVGVIKSIGKKCIKIDMDTFRIFKFNIITGIDLESPEYRIKDWESIKSEFKKEKIKKGQVWTDKGGCEWKVLKLDGQFVELLERTSSNPFRIQLLKKNIRKGYTLKKNDECGFIGVSDKAFDKRAMKDKIDRMLHELKVIIQDPRLHFGNPEIVSAHYAKAIYKLKELIKEE